MTTRLLPLLALALATPARAGDFAPPRGCETVLTVQNRACSVELVWRCEVAPEGNFWSATFLGDGLASVVNYDREYQWLDAVYTWDHSREVFTPPAADPISLSTLFDAGIDTFDFTVRRSEPDRSYDLRVVGADILTGETVTIDGFELEAVRTRIEMTADDGTVEYRASGVQYVSREFGLFFLGTEEVEEADGAVSAYDERPVDIILPGEPGFGDTTPLYDCNQQDAAFAPIAPIVAQKETDDDQV